MSRRELSEKLAPLDAQIGALRIARDALLSESKRAEGAARDARAVLEGLRRTGPDALDALDAAGRRQLYRDLELKVVAHQDRSLTMTWLVDLNLGEFGWETAGTSRRSSSRANPPPNKSFGFAMILREDTPPETSFRVLGDT